MGILPSTHANRIARFMRMTQEEELPDKNENKKKNKKKTVKTTEHFVPMHNSPDGLFSPDDMHTQIYVAQDLTTVSFALFGPFDCLFDAPLWRASGRTNNKERERGKKRANIPDTAVASAITARNLVHFGSTVARYRPLVPPPHNHGLAA